jgi:hypothetical protein
MNLYLVQSIEEMHDFNHGKMWFKIRQQALVDNKAEAVRKASAFRADGDGGEVKITNFLTDKFIALWSYLPTMDGAKSFWKRFTAKQCGEV